MFNSNVKLGIAPIAWTNDDMPDLGKENTFEQCISEMALAGFKGSEVGNKYPRDVEVLKKALELRDMEIASAWFSAFLTTKPYEETEKAFIEHRDFLNAMGAKVIVVSEQGHSIQGQMETPIFDGKYVLNEEEWKTLAEGLNKLGALAKEKGMKLVYHHHMGTVVQTTEEIDKLMDLTDENLVYLLFDSGHLVYSGEDALEVLRTKKNLRVIKCKNTPQAKNYMVTVDGGILVQGEDNKLANEYKVVTEKEPTEMELRDMIFGMKVVKYVKSNAIVVVKDGVATGIGGGQVNRIWATKEALERGKGGAVLASDAFFPFRDCVDEAAKNGVKAIIQPGGSIRDEESIEACNEHGISMVFTGVRHFKH